MEPSYIYKEREDDVDFIVGEFHKGDKFIAYDTVMQQPFIAYATFVEFINNGRVPSFLSYNQMAVLFDNISRICNFNPRINHAVFEMIYAHLSRDPDNMNIKYRHTDMKNLLHILVYEMLHMVQTQLQQDLSELMPEMASMQYSLINL